jgi:hypothetical protein
MILNPIIACAIYSCEKCLIYIANTINGDHITLSHIPRQVFFKFLMVLDVKVSITTVFSYDRMRHTADVCHLKTKCQKHVLFAVNCIRYINETFLT